MTVDAGAARNSSNTTFGTGDVTGVLALDIVCFDMHIIAATALSAEPSRDFHFDGVGNDDYGTPVDDSTLCSGDHINDDYGTPVDDSTL